MRSNSLYLLLALFFGFPLASPATGGTIPIHLKYQPGRELTSLRQRLGSTLGMAPFKDVRTGRQYIGHHRSLRGISNYFKSDPFPLERAIKESLSHTLSRYGISTNSISNWDRKPESLKKFEVDSVLLIEIDRFWTEVRSVASRANVNASIYLNIYLGVKKEGKVFAQKVYMGKEKTVANPTPERVEQIVNQLLTDIFDSFFSNPYEMPST